MTNTQIKVVDELLGATQDPMAELPVTISGKAAIETTLDYLKMFATNQYHTDTGLENRSKTMRWAEDVVSGRLGESNTHDNFSSIPASKSKNSQEFLKGLLTDFFTSLQRGDFEDTAGTGAIISGIRLFTEGTRFDREVETDDNGMNDIIWATNYVNKPELAGPITAIYNALKAGRS